MKTNHAHDFKYTSLLVALKLTVFNCINLLFICSFIGFNSETIQWLVILFLFYKIMAKKIIRGSNVGPPPPKIFKIYQIHIVNLPKSPPPFTGRQLYSPRKNVLDLRMVIKQVLMTLNSYVICKNLVSFKYLCSNYSYEIMFLQ